MKLMKCKFDRFGQKCSVYGYLEIKINIYWLNGIYWNSQNIKQCINVFNFGNIIIKFINIVYIWIIINDT